jgi:hypothetical protein
MSISSIAELVRFVRHRLRGGAQNNALPDKGDTSRARRRPRGDAPSLTVRRDASLLVCCGTLSLHSTSGGRGV